jgi:transmembrane 9 superfamily member 2/4
VYKMFKGKAFKRNTTLTAFAFPGTLFAIAFVLNLFVWRKRSSLAMPFTTMLQIIVLWFCVSTPLVFVGSYLGFKKDEIKHPVRVNNIPRQIPPQPWYLHPVPSILVGGILPFGAVFIELFFIMSSLWLAQVRGAGEGGGGGGGWGGSARWPPPLLSSAGLQV